MVTAYGHASAAGHFTSAVRILLSIRSAASGRRCTLCYYTSCGSFRTSDILSATPALAGRSALPSRMGRLVCRPALGVDLFHSIGRCRNGHLRYRFYIIIILIIFKLHLFRPAVIQAEPEKFYRLTYQHSNNRSQQRTEDRKVGIIHKIPHQQDQYFYHDSGDHCDGPGMIHTHSANEIYYDHRNGNATMVTSIALLPKMPSISRRNFAVASSAPMELIVGALVITV